MQVSPIHAICARLAAFLNERGISCTVTPQNTLRVAGYSDTNDNFHNFKDMNHTGWLSVPCDTKVELVNFMANLDEPCLVGGDLQGAAWFVNHFGRQNVIFTTCTLVKRSTMPEDRGRIIYAGVVSAGYLAERKLIADTM